MVKKILLFIFLLTILPAISAANTQIIVKTLTAYNFNVTINIMDPTITENNLLDTFTSSTGSTGQATFTFTKDVSKIKITVISYLNGKFYGVKHYGNYSTGGTITIDLFEDTPATTTTPPATPSTNTTPASITNTSANITKTNTTITAADVTPKESLFSKVKDWNWKKIGLWVGGIVLGVIVIVGCFFLFLFIKSKMAHMKLWDKKDDIVVKRSGSIIPAKMDKELMEAEKKIKEAQQTIDEIRNRKHRVAEAQKKFEEAKKELDRLKGY